MERFDTTEASSRTRALIGEDAYARLRGAHVAVFGIGGVGGYCAEALARCGVGKLTLVDADTVNVSNLNRQIIALASTLGKEKTAVMRDRIAQIDPTIQVDSHAVFFDEKNADDFDFDKYDYVADAIDSVPSKICLIERAVQAGVPIVSAMGAGNKLDPSALRVADISKTDTCPLARVVRRRLKERGILHLKTVFSSEPPVVAGLDEDGRRVPASIAFVPSVAGLLMASEIVKDLIAQTSVSAQF